MGTATREINPDSLTFTGSDGQAAEISSLRTAIASGQTIYANDLNRIGTMINNMNGHYHTYTDQYQAATFGNTGDRATYTESKNTSSIDGIQTVATNTAVGASITAARHNELQSSICTLFNHNHQIDDRTG
jgi:hypothetical protein